MAETGLPKDLFEFMQKMWNPMSFPIPGMMTPTANIDEIEAKIRELKSVENWLTMNVGFVQMTIKTLEMQKAGLEALGAGQDKTKKMPKRRPPGAQRRRQGLTPLLKRSVAFTSSAQIPGSHAECPASGTMMYSASGHARCRSSAVTIGHTAS